LLTVKGQSSQMRCTAGMASGTVLWSVLLLTSRETLVTVSGSGRGGRVRQDLPLCHDGRGLAVGVGW
jgi:hypothetical protein